MRRTRLAAGGPLISGHTYLWGTVPVDLHPLILAEPGGELGSWEVSLLDGISSQPQRTSMSGTEPLRYILLRQGTRMVSPQMTVRHITSTGSR